MDKPNSHPIVFKELAVNSYAELIEALNFNFSRIANSPIFRGKIGNPGDKGNPGYSGIRGNRLLYADVDKINVALQSDYNLDTKKFDVNAINLAMTNNYVALKQALGVDILIDDDWCVLPDGNVVTLDTINNKQTWLSLNLQILTSNDSTLKSIIGELVNAEIAGKNLGTMKLYDVAFNIVKDDPLKPEVEQANLRANEQQGGLSIKVSIAGRTNTSSNYVINALTDDAAYTKGRWPIYTFGLPTDWYNIIQNTLPIYGGKDDEYRNIGYLPNGNNVPGAVIFQNNYNNGLMLGSRNEASLRNFATIVNKQLGLSIKPKYSKFDTVLNDFFDPYVNELFLSKQIKQQSYIKSANFAIKLFAKLVGDEPAFIDAIKFVVEEQKVGDTINYVTKTIFGDDTIIQLPNRLSNGLLMAKNKELTIASMTPHKIVIVDSTGAPKTSDGTILSMPFFDDAGRYSELKLPIPPAFIETDADNGDSIAHIKHQHIIDGQTSFISTDTDVNNKPLIKEVQTSGSVDVYTIVDLPTMHPPITDTVDLSICVESIIAAKVAAAGIGLTKLKCVTSYAMLGNTTDLTKLTYKPIDTDTNLSTKAISHTELNNIAISDYNTMLQQGNRYSESAILKNVPTKYKVNTQLLLDKLVIKQTFSHLANTNIANVYVTSPKVTMLTLLTYIGINRQTVADPTYVGIGYWQLTNPAKPTDIDFVIGG